MAAAAKDFNLGALVQHGNLPVIAIVGQRGCGKSTCAQWLLLQAQAALGVEGAIVFSNSFRAESCFNAVPTNLIGHVREPSSTHAVGAFAAIMDAQEKLLHAKQPLPRLAIVFDEVFTSAKPDFVTLALRAYELNILVIVTAVTLQTLTKHTTWVTHVLLPGSVSTTDESLKRLGKKLCVESVAENVLLEGIRTLDAFDFLVVDVLRPTAAFLACAPTLFTGDADDADDADDASGSDADDASGGSGASIAGAGAAGAGAGGAGDVDADGVRSFHVSEGLQRTLLSLAGLQSIATRKRGK